MKQPRTPECNRLHKIYDKSQAIGAFLDWLAQEKELTLCRLESEEEADCETPR